MPTEPTEPADAALSNDPAAAPATVLITGGAGFIGSHLGRRLLAAGSRVVAIDNFDPFYDEALKRANLAGLAETGGDRFRFEEADIVDADAMVRLAGEVRPDLVVHIAALAGVRPSIEAPARYARVNVDGLVHVLDAARAADCRRILFASSSSVYGNNEKVPFAETDDVNEPISPYAATKRAGELLCHAYAHLFGLRIAALRFFTVFGPAQRPDLAIMKFMRLVAAGEEIPMFGDGSTSRDYTFVEDIVDGVVAAGTWTARDAAGDRPGDLAGGGCFRIFNLGGSSPISLAEMIDAIGRTVGRTPRIRPLPMQPGDVNRTWADPTRSRDELGFDPKTSFEAGLAAQWAWLQASGTLAG